jgi:hypothetical protein
MRLNPTQLHLCATSLVAEVEVMEAMEDGEAGPGRAEVALGARGGRATSPLPLVILLT